MENGKIKEQGECKCAIFQALGFEAMFQATWASSIDDRMQHGETGIMASLLMGGTQAISSFWTRAMQHDVSELYDFQVGSRISRQVLH